MRFQKARSGGEGLERSCTGAGTGWLASTTPVDGVELLREAGFADQAHFTRVFKSAFGLTPGRYRDLKAAAEPQA